MVAPLHGGPDALGVPLHDLSTNANACGPFPAAVRALQGCDARHYPDPAYTALTAQLAAWHGVAPERIVLAESASAFIQRISLALALQAGPGARVWLPEPAYGDYARAAQAAGLLPTRDAREAALLWACEPGSPLGQAEPGLAGRVDALRADQTLVLDQAYEPLRLSGAPSLGAARLERVWRLITPNKALALTGVRAACAIAPAAVDERLLARVRALTPSWPLGAHGVALLQTWATPACRDWLQGCHETLRAWKARQVAALQARGWCVQASETNFFIASSAFPASVSGTFDVKTMLASLRQRGIKLRDAESFGLPGRVRMAVVAPPVQDALLAALQRA
ncbi:aminotransferase class I/II-fold pyridoxal phosphate-dependent enzyme [Comamonas flocculans]|uniref:histidinol-phosphate transaminase n=1 Tax=Comamonas flocculans TaxID=2597701 RepID=A0A5B8RYD5_9BURK|nr:aminotransferase class I/II-fold pyridoxal phosphate-dependent enzyme [Comamonas flocculans]QEA13612.1 aminotransferase class I/II-fold pyridoxal phosphate-dependent enzyme [Comamonas flocculans]